MNGVKVKPLLDLLLGKFLAWDPMPVGTSNWGSKPFLFRLGQLGM